MIATVGWASTGVAALELGRNSLAADEEAQESNAEVEKAEEVFH